MKYAVACMNFFDNDLQITIVDSDHPIKAMIEGARILMKAKDDDEWLNSFLENLPSLASYGKRIEEIEVEFFNADQVIAITPIE